MVNIHADYPRAQQGEKKEGTVVGIDPKKQTVELSWVVVEYENVGGTKFQPIQVPKSSHGE